MNSSTSDILIVGGGVIGLTTALRLAEQGVSVIVADRRQVGREASWAGAGMLPPGNPANAESPESRLRSYSHTLWSDLSRLLFERTGIDNGFRVCGALELCHEAERGEFEQQFAAWQKEAIRAERIAKSDMRSHVVGLNDDFDSGVWLPDFAQARNPRHLKALTAACRMAGVNIIEHAEGLRLRSVGECRAEATSAEHQFHADRICVTAGAWTRHLLEPLGFVLPVKPVRGQMVQLRVQRLPFTCVIEQGRRYLVPRPDGLILVGSTEEHVGFVKRNTAEGVSGLLRFAESLVSDLRSAEVVRSWSGLRPGSPSELPYLGQVPGYDNMFVAAGHFRSGLQMSPGSGQILADLLLDREPRIRLDGLTCDRVGAEA
ncbi:MAG: glycine oxidase ThiO [Planctomycetaceae bacterium]